MTTWLIEKIEIRRTLGQLIKQEILENPSMKVEADPQSLQNMVDQAGIKYLNS